MSAKDTETISKKCRWPRRILRVLAWLVMLGWGTWCFGALWFDFPLPGRARLVAAAFGLLWLALAAGWRCGGKALATTATLAGLITAWWWTLQPLQYRDWKPEVALLPYAQVDGDVVTIRNVRNFNYRTVDDFDIRHEERRYRLSALRGVDLFLNYWGSPMMSHPILSFDFGPDGRICFSIETRPEKSEAYSALRGLYRGFELICIAADERDVIRLRTNYRKGEETYLYRLQSARPREAFLEYVSIINQLHERPKWYNAVTQNCTTSLRSHREKSRRAPWDWRMLANGYLDELLYEHRKIDTSLPFAELRKRSLVNAKARQADADPGFSERTREGLPGF